MKKPYESVPRRTTIFYSEITETEERVRRVKKVEKITRRTSGVLISKYTYQERTKLARNLAEKMANDIEKGISKDKRKRWEEFISSTRKPVREIEPPKLDGYAFWFSIDTLAIPDKENRRVNLMYFLNFHSLQEVIHKKVDNMHFFYLKKDRNSHTTMPYDHALRLPYESYRGMFSTNEAIAFFEKPGHRMIPYGTKVLVFKQNKKTNPLLTRKR